MALEAQRFPDTIIEIYDDEQIYNVLAVAEWKPANVVFIGTRKLKSKRVKNNIITCLRKLGLDTKCFFFSADMLNIEAVTSELKSILAAFGDVVIDLTGGSEVALVAVGMIAKEMEREGRKIPLIRYDRNSYCYRNIYGCEAADGAQSNPHFTVDSLLALAGASLKAHGHISLEKMDEETAADIFRVWSIYKKHHRGWHKTVAYLQQISKNLEGDDLHVSAPRVVFGTTISGADTAVMDELASSGIIRRYKNDAGISFDYKNSLMRSCLCDTGICLELYVYATAINSEIYDDVQISVVIDWDGNLDARINTINEIDVMLTRGMVPTFISCKSGLPNVTALNEIKTLAKQFGGVYAKPVLVTMADVRRRDKFLWQRAKDMGVEIVDREDLINERLAKRLYHITKI